MPYGGVRKINPMTTKVTIINHGPSPVKIEAQSRNEKGQFAAAEEFTINPGAFLTDIYVHKTRSFQVLEDDGAE